MDSGNQRTLSGLAIRPHPATTPAQPAAAADRSSRARALPLLGVVFVLVGMLASPVARGGVAGSPHDFTTLGWSEDELCVACHTPHDADESTIPLYGPLWNHELTTATFTLYSSPTMYGTPIQPTGPSLLCLSCHDGSVAIDSYGGVTGTTFMSGLGLIGTDLSDDHPISIAWEHQTQQGNCFDCHDVRGGTDGPTFISPLPFYDGRVECPTCHDVHDTSGTADLLQISNDGSELCLHCHGK